MISLSGGAIDPAYYTWPPPKVESFRRVVTTLGSPTFTGPIVAVHPLWGADVRLADEEHRLAHLLDYRVMFRIYILW